MDSVLLLQSDRSTLVDCQRMLPSLHVVPSATLEDADVERRSLVAILVDVATSGAGGLTACQSALRERPEVPLLALVDDDTETAVSAVRAGAQDLLVLPLDETTLAERIAHAREQRRLREAMQSATAKAASTRAERARLTHARASLTQLIGESAPMNEVRALIDRLGTSKANVLIEGESGTGKEVAARTLHGRSGREGPFLAVNCAAFPHGLLESELFGHARGAFTDAKVARPGLLLDAHGGTLLLDEVGELDLTMQPKLLRALQERRVRPVGGSREQPFDTRLVAATNSHLDREVRAGRFREDLYYRLNVVSIELPPLRHRGRDILLLARHFLEKQRRARDKSSRKAVRGISAEVEQLFLEYDWPGNVRELENTLERALMLGRSEEITLADLPGRIRRRAHGASSNGGSGSGADRRSGRPQSREELLTLEALEQRYVRKVLEAAGGNKSEAARLLGVDRRTLYRKLDRWAEGGAQVLAATPAPMVMQL